MVIIGGGLSGLTAAYTLRNSHHTVTLLEANDRLGGRTYGLNWDAADRMIDMGGTWLLPNFSRAFALLDELGIDTIESPASELWFTHFRRGVVMQQHLDAAERAELDRALELIARIAKEAGEPMSAEEALSRAAQHPDAPSALIEDWQRAMQRYLAGAPLEEVDVAHLLLDPEDIADPEHYCTQITGTTQTLTDALAQAITADVSLETSVRGLSKVGDDFVITTSTGSEYRARQVILAVPVNCMMNINIDAQLLGTYREVALAGHVGASRKDWLVLDGVSEHFRVFASEGPYGYFRSEEKLADGGMLAVGLVPSAEDNPSTSELEAIIQEHYLPHATIRSHTTHDWLGDPTAQGTWFVPRPGQYATLARATTGDPHLIVAGGDVDSDFPSTIEGAIASGERVARQILSR